MPKIMRAMLMMMNIFNKPCLAYADTANSTITAITSLVAIFTAKKDKIVTFILLFRRERQGQSIKSTVCTVVYFQECDMMSFLLAAIKDEKTRSQKLLG